MPRLLAKPGGAALPVPGGWCCGTGTHLSPLPPGHRSCWATGREWTVTGHVLDDWMGVGGRRVVRAARGLSRCPGGASLPAASARPGRVGAEPGPSGKSSPTSGWRVSRVSRHRSPPGRGEPGHRWGPPGLCAGKNNPTRLPALGWAAGTWWALVWATSVEGAVLPGRSDGLWPL